PLAEQRVVGQRPALAVLQARQQHAHQRIDDEYRDAGKNDEDQHEKDRIPCQYPYLRSSGGEHAAQVPLLLAEYLFDKAVDEPLPVLGGVGRIIGDEVDLLERGDALAGGDVGADRQEIGLLVGQGLLTFLRRHPVDQRLGLIEVLRAIED